MSGICGVRVKIAVFLLFGFLVSALFELESLAGDLTAGSSLSRIGLRVLGCGTFDHHG